MDEYAAAARVAAMALGNGAVLKDAHALWTQCRALVPADRDKADGDNEAMLIALSALYRAAGVTIVEARLDVEVQDSA